MIEVSNADRVVFPEVTKRDVVAYYDRVGTRALVHLEGRPLSIKRFPKPPRDHGGTRGGAPRGAASRRAHHRVPHRAARKARVHGLAPEHAERDVGRLLDRPDTLAELARTPGDTEAFVAKVDAAFERSGLVLESFDRFRS